MASEAAWIAGNRAGGLVLLAASASGSGPQLSPAWVREAGRLGGPPLSVVYPVRQPGLAVLTLPEGLSPLGLPYTLSHAPLRRRAPSAWLARALASAEGFALRLPSTTDWSDRDMTVESRRADGKHDVRE